jgi:hypothetical protein
MHSLSGVPRGLEKIDGRHQCAHHRPFAQNGEIKQADYDQPSLGSGSAARAAGHTQLEHRWRKMGNSSMSCQARVTP